MASHILIIDRDRNAARITRAGVERVAPEATVAVEPDPERGLASLERRYPDLLIIDPPRHILSTGRLIQAIKRETPEAQVIVLASEPTPSLRESLRRLGADIYLAKPAPLATLREALLHAVYTLEQRRSGAHAL